MKKFNYDSYMRDNPLMKETSGYGNYIPGEKMLEDIGETESKYAMAEFNDELSAMVAKAKTAGIPKQDLENMFRWSLSNY